MSLQKQFLKTRSLKKTKPTSILKGYILFKVFHHSTSSLSTKIRRKINRAKRTLIILFMSQLHIRQFILCQKDFLSQKPDSIYFIFNKPYLCKFDSILVWKKLQLVNFLKCGLITFDITWNLYRKLSFGYTFFLEYLVSFFIIFLMDESIAKKK